MAHSIVSVTGSNTNCLHRCATPPHPYPTIQRLRMMIKPVVLVKGVPQENGPDQQTENQSQNPANEEAYI